MKMNRLQHPAVVVGLAILACGMPVGGAENPARQGYTPAALGSPTLSGPISVYDDWSTYDELSDHVPLTQALAMKELDQMLRLKRAGVRFDYYVMDAFWFDPSGAYRTWMKPNWPDGPDAWINKCEENGIKPGLWFSTNTLVHLKATPQWRDSLNKQGTAMSMFEGGFLPDFMNTLQFWYDHGIRMFLFDFADMTAATPHDEATMTPAEIVQRNSDALRNTLTGFRQKHPGVVLEAFNGFGGVMDSTSYPFPFKDPVDLRWLKVFDAVYCGDPRPADVPEMNFWRALDIYSDHQDRRYQEAGVPLERIDTTSFMPGDTGTIYRRGLREWKGSLILMLARGGWINTTYGNLEKLTAEDARWFARVQSLYLHFQADGRIHTFGGIPGDVRPYGFGALDGDGSVYVVVNPAQSFQTLRMPLLSRDQEQLGKGRLLFRDAGYDPQLSGAAITLGPGQMAMVGFRKYASPYYDLGIQQDVVVPRAIDAVAANFKNIDKGTIQATIAVPPDGDLRVILQQYSPDGSLRRTRSGENMGKVFLLKAEQSGHDVPVRKEYDRVIWAGLSWAAGEISAKDLLSDKPVTLTLQSTEKNPVVLKGHVYQVRY